jgi:diguanylate cyclase (GGDEF)-like protein
MHSAERGLVLATIVIVALAMILPLPGWLVKAGIAAYGLFVFVSFRLERGHGAAFRLICRLLDLTALLGLALLGGDGPVTLLIYLSVARAGLTLDVRAPAVFYVVALTLTHFTVCYFSSVPGAFWAPWATSFAGFILTFGVSRLMNSALGKLESNAGANQELVEQKEGLYRDLAASYEQLAEKNERLQLLQTHDPLTGAFNHMSFQEQLQAQIETSVAKGAPLALLLIDIDSFGHYNSHLGHGAGDEVLRRVALTLERTLGLSAVLSRYQADDFAALVPGLDGEGALELAERIRCAIAAERFPGEEALPGGRLTVSIGLACCPAHARTRESLIHKAQEALEQSKRAGQNQVHLYYSVLEGLEDELSSSAQALLSAVQVLLTIINTKDHYTYGHTERVVSYALALGDHLGLSPDQRNTLKYGAFLHDVGKIQVDQSVLDKTGQLTADDWRQLRQHPTWGAEIVGGIESLADVIPLIKHHHERYDGNGYPQGLSGERIPYLARILTIADSYDAMTTDRPYKLAKTRIMAIKELRGMAGSQFDPSLVEGFAEVLERQADEEGEDQEGLADNA